MGATGAIGFANAVEHGQVTRVQALHWHLTSNHYPPLPAEYGTPLGEAIDHVSDGNPEHLVALPTGIDPTPRRSTVEDGTVFVQAADLVSACNAWAFVEGDDD